MGHADFRDRVARIETRAVKDGRKAPTGGLRRVVAVLILPVTLPLALGFGAALVALAHGTRLRLLGLPPDPATLAAQIASDGLIALALLLVVRLMMGWRSALHGAAQLAGVAGATLALPIAVHRWPEPFLRTLGAEWVTLLEAASAPDALLLPPVLAGLFAAG